MRSPLLPLLFTATLVNAQTDTSRTRTVKSGAMEMRSEGNTVTTSVSSSGTLSAPAITGDFTVSCAHPKCAQASTTEERANCTAAEVLQQINAHLQAEQPKSLDIVALDFDVDEYGDVKAIRANASTEPALGKAVIVALYGLPKFEVAKKNGKRAASHCSFSYHMADLFAKPGMPAATIDSAAVAKPPAPAAPPAALVTITSQGQIISGDFSTPCAHPKCVKSRTAEERTACTASEVLSQIKEHLKAEKPSYLDVVVVDFDVDVYGDVKTIRANCSTEPDLGQAVIVALYGLPKFEAARKGDARAASHCTFSYPVGDLFSKP